jgi:hypothetical protein
LLMPICAVTWVANVAVVVMLVVVMVRGGARW